MSTILATPTQYIVQQNLDLWIKDHLAHTSGHTILIKIHTNEVTQILFHQNAETSYHQTQQEL